MAKQKLIKTNEQWRKQLTPEQYQVLREKGTEPAFAGKYYKTKDKGVYRCAACGNELFSSDTKFDSGSGWPSFYDLAHNDAIELRPDNSFGLPRTEVICAKCASHLGHLFDDGPKDKGGQRYCINSCALDFKKKMSWFLESIKIQLAYMALTYVKIKIINPANEKNSQAIQMMVDSGALYSVAPGSTLKKLGIRARSKKVFTLANGEAIERLIGDAVFEYLGERGASPVIFGESGDSQLLGAVTLEALGLMLDPLKREIRPLPMVLGGFENRGR